MNKYLIFIILCLLPLQVFTQNETGLRSMSMDSFKGTLQYANDTTMIYHKQYPIIRDIPPLSASMPLDILLSYIYLDSASRHLDLLTFRSYMNALTEMNDTLKNTMKYYYKAVDYNPIIFRQYASETQIDQHQRYSTPVNEIEAFALSKFRSFTHDSVKYALYSMLKAEYILKIKITAIDSMRSPHKMYRGDTTKYHYFQAECIVQDTIKGKVFNSFEPIAQLYNRVNSENPVMMTFSFSDLSYPQPSWGMNINKATEPWYPKVDTNLINDKRDFMPQIGQELIIFLTHKTKLYDEHNDYY